MFGLVHRYAPESTRARGLLTLLFSLTVVAGILPIFITRGLIVPVLAGIVGVAGALALTLGMGLVKQAEAAPASENPAWDPNARPATGVDPVETLQQRYAEGEVGDEEFEHRMDRLLNSGQQAASLDEETEPSRTVERATE